MALSDRHLLDSLGGMPLIDSAELAGILGEAHLRRLEPVIEGKVVLALVDPSDPVSSYPNG